MMIRFLVVGLAVGLLAGCGDEPRLAKVSGVIKLDGKPYANAMISFQPKGGKDKENPGKGSSGITDANGKFELIYDGKKEGAVVGTHLVRISTMPGKGQKDDPSVDTSLGSPDGAAASKGDFDPIPLEWNEKSTHTFEVTSAGTDVANFDIVTPPKRKK